MNQATEVATAGSTPVVGEVNWTKLADGRWGIRGPASLIKVGESVQVLKRSGRASVENVTGILSTVEGISIATVVPREQSPKVAHSSGRRRGRDYAAADPRSRNYVPERDDWSRPQSRFSGCGHEDYPCCGC